MIQVVPQVRVFQCRAPVDFRKGIDGLASLCRSQLNRDPMSGSMFLFINRHRTAVKILVYDGQGFWLCQKRLSTGRFRFWEKGEGTTILAAHELQVLLYNGNPARLEAGATWRRVSPED